MIFSLFLFQKGLNWQKLAVLIVINAFFVVFLMLLIKKGPLIALMLVTGFLAVMFKNKKLYLVFAVGVIGMIGVILFIPKVNARFSELLQVQHADESMTNSTNIRFSIYECVMKVIPEAGALGYGIGDGKNELINCYENNISFLADHKYNSHNQFMGIILKVGYVGLGLFTLFLLFHLVRAFERKNYLLISVLMFYCIVMFSENIIERENGVLYFSLFINLFLMLDYNYKSQSSANPVIENLSKN
jgi:O-antigen ligase